MSLWISTGLGSYDISTKQGWTQSSIDSAYDSYSRVLDRWMLSTDFVLPSEPRSQFKQMRRDYYNQLSIDSRQNVEPLIEKPEKTITKACQYAQACLVRDLRRIYPSLAELETLKKQVDEILAVSPESIHVQLSPVGADTNQFRASYIDIRDPTSAAKFLGLLNTADTLLEYTAHYTLMDRVLVERISEAHPPEPICSKCGNVGQAKDRFCRKCGNPLK